MLHHPTPLIATIVAGLVLAFLLGLLAHRLRLSPLIGYLVAGVIVGPWTPGWVANQALATELAEIGVILLMFGVGLHFSLRDLLAVRRIAIPGALAQIAVATGLGWGLAALMGWSAGAGILFGLSLSVASTVVLLRALQQRRLVDTERGRIAVGWLIVEDLAMVFALVLLPAVATARGDAGTDLPAIGLAILATLGKVALFMGVMLVVGRRLIPMLLHGVAHSGSRELFRLAVLATALGVAYGAAMLFGVSFALGAFFAGMILAESQLSQRAAEETLPLRDAFAVLFFVSVGMLFNPWIVVTAPFAFLATLAIIVVGKSLAAFAIVRAFGRSRRVALVIAASLAQIGEFSFILASLGTGLGVLPAEGRDLILGGAIVSIMLNPLLFNLVHRWGADDEAAGQGSAAEPPPAGHLVLVGFGRVGAHVAAGLSKAGRRLVVVEAEGDVAGLRDLAGVERVIGNAAHPAILARTRLADADALYVAIPGAFEAGQIVQQARAARPDLRIVARVHSEEEAAHLTRLGADRTIMGEREIAVRMVEDAALGPVTRAKAPASV